jgi:hypothetical protein
MADIIKIDSNNIIDFLHSSASFSVAKPYNQQIFLIEAHIAGTTYIDYIDEIEPKLVEGLKLKFVREADNPHDSLAIMIRDNDGRKLGYVPRNKNEILSRLMDAGKLIYGTVYRKERFDNWLKISIQIFMDD